MREQLLAGEEDGPGRDHAEELDRGEEDREDLLHVDGLRLVRVVQLVELGLERALAVERLHDRHPRDRLGNLRGDGADAVPLLDERDVRRVREPAGEEQRGREDCEHDEAQSPVGDEQRRERRREEDDIRDERRHPLGKDVADGVDVARQAGDDPARLLLREVPERQAGEVVEQIAAQAEHHALADAGEPADEDRLQDPADRGYSQVDRDDDRQVMRIARANAVVDGVADEEPAARLAGGIPHRDEDHQRRAQLQALEIPRQASHAASSSPKSAAKGPFARTSSAGRPASTISPSTRTTARSAISTVDRRCVATSTVLPSSAGRSR